MRIRVFNKPNASRVRERAYLEHLLQGHDAEHVAEDFPLTEQQIRKPVDTKRLARQLAADRYMPPARRRRMIDILDALPSRVFIATTPRRVSFDFVIARGSECFYAEFHEEQHLNLSVDRPQKVYAEDGAAHVVPRFVQRFIRDVWRAEKFSDFTIVWHDWFEANRNLPAAQLTPGLRELHLPNAFSLVRLLER